MLHRNGDSLHDRCSSSVQRILKVVGNDPLRIRIGTAVLALIVSLDGDGATTYMITVSAMLPLYRHVKLDARKMACLIIMAGAVMNILPWGGPTARVAAALRLDPAVVFVPMIPAMLICAGWAASVLHVIPAQLGPYMAPIVGLLSVPFTFLISNDAFYFGMLPILAETAAAHGIAPEAVACASLVGQQVHLLSPLVPSTYLLVGLAGIDFGEHQRFTLPWALGSCAVMFVSALLLGISP